MPEQDVQTIAGLRLFTPTRFGDDRGWFREVWNADRWAAEGLQIDWRQDNHSFSAQKGTLRGLHYQAPPHAQDKLVWCSRGAVWDVAVDIRVGSPTYLGWAGVELSAENGRQFLIPKGFLHGFVTLTDMVELQYKCSHTYAPDSDRAIRWDDPQIGIDWPVDMEADAPTLSDKDAAAPYLRAAPSPFTWETGA